MTLLHKLFSRFAKVRVCKERLLDHAFLLFGRNAVDAAPHDKRLLDMLIAGGGLK